MPQVLICRRPPTPRQIEDRPSTSSQLLLSASIKHDRIPPPPSTRSRCSQASPAWCRRPEPRTFRGTTVWSPNFSIRYAVMYALFSSFVRRRPLPPRTPMARTAGNVGQGPRGKLWVQVEVYVPRTLKVNSKASMGAIHFRH
ncbi:hypothetical protein EJB05_26392 [Eragrostis curvula]|uniref:Uncharacterized protein n=1 Tax=Eragrostis curvula TaxID=38414 RepID=A0A5J9ULG8_9POAL|nr:hypothetical protein EJB05_26392 [Eragrostis curvula]